MSDPSHHDKRQDLNTILNTSTFEDLETFVKAHPEHFPLVTQVQSYLDGLENTLQTPKNNQKHSIKHSLDTKNTPESRRNGDPTNINRIGKFFKHMSLSISTLTNSMSSLGVGFLSTFKHEYLQRASILEQYAESIASLPLPIPSTPPLSHLHDIITNNYPFKNITLVIDHLDNLLETVSILDSQLAEAQSSSSSSSSSTTTTTQVKNHDKIKSCQLLLIAQIIPICLTMSYFGQIIAQLQHYLNTSNVHVLFRPNNQENGDSISSSSYHQHHHQASFVIAWGIFHTFQNIITLFTTLILHLAFIMYKHCIPRLTSILMSSHSAIEHAQRTLHTDHDGDGDNDNNNDDKLSRPPPTVDWSMPSLPPAIVNTPDALAEVLHESVDAYRSNVFEHIIGVNHEWVEECNNLWKESKRIGERMSDENPPHQAISSYSYTTQLFAHLCGANVSLSFDDLHSSDQTVQSTTRGSDDNVSFTLPFCFQQLYLSQLLCIKAYQTMFHQHTSFGQFHALLFSSQLMEMLDKPSIGQLHQQWKSLAFPSVLTALSLNDLVSGERDTQPSSQPPSSTATAMESESTSETATVTATTLAGDQLHVQKLFDEYLSSPESHQGAEDGGECEPAHTLILIPYEQCIRCDWVTQMFVNIHYLKHVHHFYEPLTDSNPLITTDTSIAFQRYKVISPFPSISKYVASQIKSYTHLFHFIGMCYNSVLTFSTLQHFSHELTLFKQKTFIHRYPLHGILHSIPNLPEQPPLYSGGVGYDGSVKQSTNANDTYLQYIPYFTYGVKKWAASFTMAVNPSWYPLQPPTQCDPFISQQFLQDLDSCGIDRRELSPDELIALIYSPISAYVTGLECILHETVILMMKDIGRDVLLSIEKDTIVERAQHEYIDGYDYNTSMDDGKPNTHARRDPHPEHDDDDDDDDDDHFDFDVEFNKLLCDDSDTGLDVHQQNSSGNAHTMHGKSATPSPSHSDDPDKRDIDGDDDDDDGSIPQIKIIPQPSPPGSSTRKPPLVTIIPPWVSSSPQPVSAEEYMDQFFGIENNPHYNDFYRLTDLLVNIVTELTQNPYQSPRPQPSASKTFQKTRLAQLIDRHLEHVYTLEQSNSAFGHYTIDSYLTTTAAHRRKLHYLRQPKAHMSGGIDDQIDQYATMLSTALNSVGGTHESNSSLESSLATHLPRDIAGVSCRLTSMLDSIDGLIDDQKEIPYMELYHEAYQLYSIVIAELGSMYTALHEAMMFGVTVARKASPSPLIDLPLILSCLQSPSRPKTQPSQPHQSTGRIPLSKENGQLLITYLACYCPLSYNDDADHPQSHNQQEDNTFTDVYSFFHSHVYSQSGGNSMNPIIRGIPEVSVSHMHAILSSTGGIPLIQRSHPQSPSDPQSRSHTSGVIDPKGANGDYLTTLRTSLASNDLLKRMKQSPLTLELFNRFHALYHRGITFNPYDTKPMNNFLHHAVSRGLLPITTPPLPSSSKYPPACHTAPTLQTTFFSRCKDLSSVFFSTSFTRHMFYNGIVAWAIGNLSRVNRHPTQQQQSNKPGGDGTSSSTSSSQHKQPDVQWKYLKHPTEHSLRQQSKSPSLTIDMPIPVDQCGVLFIGSDQKCSTYTHVNQLYDQLIREILLLVIQSTTTLHQKLEMVTYVVLPVLYAISRINNTCQRDVMSHLHSHAYEPATKLMEIPFELFNTLSGNTNREKRHQGYVKNLRTGDLTHWFSTLTRTKSKPSELQIDQTQLFESIDQLLVVVHTIIHYQRTLEHIDNDYQFQQIHLYHQYLMNHQVYWNRWHSLQQLCDHALLPPSSVSPPHSPPSTSPSPSPSNDLPSLRMVDIIRGKTYMDHSDCQLAQGYTSAILNLPPSLPVTNHVIQNYLLDKPLSPFLVTSIVTLNDYKALINHHMAWENRVFMKEVYGILTKIRRLYLGTVRSLQALMPISGSDDGNGSPQYTPISSSKTIIPALGYPASLPLPSQAVLAQIFTALIPPSQQLHDDQALPLFITSLQSSKLDFPEDMELINEFNRYTKQHFGDIDVDPLTITMNQPFGCFYQLSRRYPLSDHFQQSTDRLKQYIRTQSVDMTRDGDQLFYILLACLIPNQDQQPHQVVDNAVNSIKAVISDLMHANYSHSTSPIAFPPHSLNVLPFTPLLNPYHKAIHLALCYNANEYSKMSLQFFSSGSNLFRTMLAGWNNAFISAEHEYRDAPSASTNNTAMSLNTGDSHSHMDDNNQPLTTVFTNTLASSSMLLDGPCVYFIDMIKRYNLPYRHSHQFILELLDQLDINIFSQWLEPFSEPFHHLTLQVIFCQVMRLVSLISQVLHEKHLSITPPELPPATYLFEYVQLWSTEVNASQLPRVDTYPLPILSLITSHYMDIEYKYATYDQEIKHAIFMEICNRCRLNFSPVPDLQLDALDTIAKTSSVYKQYMDPPFLFRNQQRHQHQQQHQDNNIQSIQGGILDLLPRTRSFLILTLLSRNSKNQLQDMFEQIELLSEMNVVIDTRFYAKPPVDGEQEDTANRFRPYGEPNRLRSQNVTPGKLAFILACYGIVLPLDQCQDILSLHGNRRYTRGSSSLPSSRVDGLDFIKHLSVERKPSHPPSQSQSSQHHNIHDDMDYTHQDNNHHDHFFDDRNDNDGDNDYQHDLTNHSNPTHPSETRNTSESHDEDDFFSQISQEYDKKPTSVEIKPTPMTHLTPSNPFAPQPPAITTTPGTIGTTNFTKPPIKPILSIPKFSATVQPSSSTTSRTPLTVPSLSVVKTGILPPKQPTNGTHNSMVPITTTHVAPFSFSPTDHTQSKTQGNQDQGGSHPPTSKSDHPHPTSPEAMHDDGDEFSSGFFDFS